MGLRIVTWNVNGIRNPFSYEPWRSKRTFESMFDLLAADVVIFQETKIQRKDLTDDMVLVPGWDCYFSLPKTEKGKFGVVIYTRQSTCAPIRAEEGLSGVLKAPNSTLSFNEITEDKQIGGYPSKEQMRDAPGAPSDPEDPRVAEISENFEYLDSEGRCVILEFPAFVLFGVYAPATRGPTRAPFKTAYMNLLDARIRNLIHLGKRVVLTGDLNVSKEPLDVANIETDLRKAGETVEEYFGTGTRRMFNHLVIGGTVVGPRDAGREEQVLWDVCRSFHPTRKGMYTHWETKINARPANYGSRIDYILCSPEMRDWFSESNIQEGLHGSDHCPVYAIMKEQITINGQDVHTSDVMNPPGLFKDGRRIRQHATKDILPMSGRLIPDFTGRQSIRDMFSRKPAMSQWSSSSQHMGGGSPTKSPIKEDNAMMKDDDTGLSTIGESSATTSFEAESPAGSQGGSSTSSHRLASASNLGSSVSGSKRLQPEKAGSSFGGGSGSVTRPLKKSKSASASGNSSSSAITGGGPSAHSPVKGQSQISGFFKPKTPKASSGSEIRRSSSETHAEADAPLSVTGNLSYPEASRQHHANEDLSSLSKPIRPTSRQSLESGMVELPSDDAASSKQPDPGEPKLQRQPLPPLSEPMDPARDQEENRSSWAKLFSKPQVPMCEHEEPCKIMLSKKQGANYMRSFYMCARPLGPSGEKERGTQWRCRTFVWASQAKQQQQQ